MLICAEYLHIVLSYSLKLPGALTQMPREKSLPIWTGNCKHPSQMTVLNLLQMRNVVVVSSLFSNSESYFNSEIEYYFR